MEWMHIASAIIGLMGVIGLFVYFWGKGKLLRRFGIIIYVIALLAFMVYRTIIERWSFWQKEGFVIVGIAVGLYLVNLLFNYLEKREAAQQETQKTEERGMEEGADSK